MSSNWLPYYGHRIVISSINFFCGWVPFLASGFFGFWVLGSVNYFEFSQNPLFWHANFTEPKKPACLRKRRTQHDDVKHKSKSTWHRWPRLVRSNFELKIINLFHSSSFVYLKKPCSKGSGKFFFPEPRTQKIQNWKDNDPVDMNNNMIEGQSQGMHKHKDGWSNEFWF
jgi:hypothetical protein